MPNYDGMTIKVGAIVFTVCEVDGIRDSNDVKIDGRIGHNECEIEVEKSLSPQTKRQVIWHEILHSILLQAGIRDHDEGLVEALSFGIFGVLQDNECLMSRVEPAGRDEEITSDVLEMLKGHGSESS